MILGRRFLPRKWTRVAAGDCDAGQLNGEFTSPVRVFGRSLGDICCSGKGKKETRIDAKVSMRIGAVFTWHVATCGGEGCFQVR